MRTELTAEDLEALRGCAAREAAMRARCYPKWVEGGRMTEAKAEEELRLMRGIERLLRELRDERTGQRELF